MTSALPSKNFVQPEYTAPAPGRKDDQGKLDVNLILDDCPLALKAMAEVMQWAITKKQPAPYERGSWQGVHPDRYRAAAGRHLLAASEQAKLSNTNMRFERDQETNLLHLAHRATSAVFELELTMRELAKKAT